MRSSSGGLARGVPSADARLLRTASALHFTSLLGIRALSGAPAADKEPQNADMHRKENHCLLTCHGQVRRHAGARRTLAGLRLKIIGFSTAICKRILVGYQQWDNPKGSRQATTHLCRCCCSPNMLQSRGPSLRCADTSAAKGPTLSGGSRAAAENLLWKCMLASCGDARTLQSTLLRFVLVPCTFSHHICHAECSNLVTVSNKNRTLLHGFSYCCIDSQKAAFPAAAPPSL